MKIIMRNCAIYSPNLDLDKVEEIITELYKRKNITVNESKSKIKVITKKLFSKNVNIFNIQTSKNDTDKFNEMINGMYNFYKQIPAKKEVVKEKLLIQISATNMAIAIVAQKDISEEFYKEILTIANKLNGIVFGGENTLVNSDGELILDFQGNSEVDDLIVTADTSYLHENLKETESGLKRKQISEKIMNKFGIPYINHLPLIVGDEHVKIKTIEEIAKRAISLSIVALKAECELNRQEKTKISELVHMVTDIFKAKLFFSKEENKFLSNLEPTESESIQMVWRYEGLWVLLWTLGFIPKLEFPNKICDVEKSVKILKSMSDVNEFIDKSNLRKKEEILDEADLIYRYNWACVDARVKGQQAPGELDSEVVVERHKTLNWIINYMNAQWDDVRADT